MPFQILAPVGALMIVTTTLAPLLTAKGRPDIMLRYTLTCLAVYPISFLIVAKSYGLIGVCATWLVLYPLQTLLFIHSTRHVTSIPVPAFAMRLAPIFLALAAMIAATLAVKFSSIQPGLYRMTLSASVGAAVYICTATSFIGFHRLIEIAVFF